MCVFTPILPGSRPAGTSFRYIQEYTVCLETPVIFANSLTVTNIETKVCNIIRNMQTKLAQNNLIFFKQKFAMSVITRIFEYRLQQTPPRADPFFTLT